MASSTGSSRRRQADAEFAERVRQRLGDQAAAVGAALPRLAGLLGQPDTYTSVPEAAGEVRTLNALVNFLRTLGTSERPALVVLDDCQWADDLTYRLIHRWATQTRTAHVDNRVLLIAAFRSEEVPADHPLRRMQPTLHLGLSGLSAQEMQQLVESMAGPLPPDVVSAVTRLADNSPFMASAVLRGLVESGNLVSER